MLDFSTFDSIVLWDGVNKPHPELHCDNEFPDQLYMVAKPVKPCQLKDKCHVEISPWLKYHHDCAREIFDEAEVYVCECRECYPRYSFYYRAKDSQGGNHCYWCWKGLCKKP